MIVREDGDALWLITQPDHAVLAADLMQAWQADGLPERPTRTAALFATSRHDIGWTDFDESPTIEPASGRPVDFLTAPVAMKQAVWWRAVEVLPQQSTYAAALVSQHALTLFRRFRGEPQWMPFFDGLERERDRWFLTDRRLDGSAGGEIDPPCAARITFLQDYATLRTGDVLSLTFCNAWTSPQNAEGYTVVSSGEQLRVSPDPFGGMRVPFRVRARRIANRAYRDEAHLRATLRAAEDRVLEGVARGG
jgi:hypothetical protein